MTTETPTKRKPFPTDGICECGCSDEWRDVESGYTRYSSGTWEDGVLRVFQDGWDDMSEGGDDQYVQCFACFAEYESPDIEYD